MGVLEVFHNNDMPWGCGFRDWNKCWLPNPLLGIGFGRNRGNCRTIGETVSVSVVESYGVSTVKISDLYLPRVPGFIHNFESPRSEYVSMFQVYVPLYSDGTERKDVFKLEEVIDAFWSSLDGLGWGVAFGISP